MNESTLVKVVLELPAEVVAYFDEMGAGCSLLGGEKSGEELMCGLLCERYINEQAEDLLSKVRELEGILNSPESIMEEILSSFHAQSTGSEERL